MYGVEWLIVLGLLGLAAGLAGGYLVAGTAGRGGRRRELEQQLDSARRELADYRKEVVGQFSETARKFQALNDAYTDLHEQLARSSGVLCGDLTGPLLTAPNGHQDLIPAEVRAALTAAQHAATADGTVDPYDDAVDIRVAEPLPGGRAAAALHTPATEAGAEPPAPAAHAGDDPQPTAEAGPRQRAGGSSR